MRRKPRQARARDTRESIISAASLVLEARGPRALTTNAVAKRAGVSIGSLYEYFANKDEILIELARRRLREDCAVMLEHLEQGLEGTLEQVAARVVGALLELHRRQMVARRTAMAVHLRQGFESEHEVVVGLVAQRLRRLRVNGRVLLPVTLFVVSRAVLGVVRAALRESPALLVDPALGSCRRRTQRSGTEHLGRVHPRQKVPASAPSARPAPEETTKRENWS